MKSKSLLPNATNYNAAISACEKGLALNRPRSSSRTFSAKASNLGATRNPPGGLVEPPGATKKNNPNPGWLAGSVRRYMGSPHPPGPRARWGDTPLYGLTHRRH